MKVGIITFHRANNFGAVLQCYALQTVLLKLGYDTKVIDYREPFTEFIYNPIRWDIIKKGYSNPRLLAGYLLKVFPERYKRARQYNKFRRDFLKMTLPVRDVNDFPQDFDVYLIGSDQMWSLHVTGNNIVPVFFGDFPKPDHSNIQGYAISSNVESINCIGKSLLSKYVKNFKRLSFRENTISDEIKRLTGCNSETVLDPTFLLTFNDWNKLVSERIIKKKYLLTYFLHTEANNTDYKQHIYMFAKQQNLELINMFDIAFSPLTFLNLIKYSDCIITSSFHAVIFSIIFKKNFFALKTNDGKDIRYVNIMNILGIERLIEFKDLLNLSIQNIDYTNSEQKLSQLKNISLNYLKTL